MALNGSGGTFAYPRVPENTQGYPGIRKVSLSVMVILGGEVFVPSPLFGTSIALLISYPPYLNALFGQNNTKFDRVSGQYNAKMLFLSPSQTDFGSEWQP